MNTTSITIRGITPLLMHNGQLADPLNESTKALKRLTTKKQKTDADHLATRKCEWYGSLYVDASGRPCLPGEMLEACLRDGGKRLKLGPKVKGGVIIEGDWPIEYTGPKSIDKLWDSGSFAKLAGVRNQQNRVIRCRPIFPEWSCTFDVFWDPAMISDEDQLTSVVESAGIAGIGDWRPKFGRFEVV